MFDSLFKQAAAIELHQQAPLYAERLRYLQHLEHLGVARRTLRAIAPLLLAIVSGFALIALRRVTTEQIATLAEIWSSREASKKRRKHGNAARTKFESVARNWFRFLNVLEIKRVDSPFAEELEAYTYYLREERCLSPVTIRVQCCRVAEFLRFVDSRKESLNQVSIDTIDKLIGLKSSRDKLTRPSIQRYCYDLRSFLNFTESRGWSRPSLAAGIRPPRVYRDEVPPVGPSWATIGKLLADTNGNQPGQIRAHAIILLLAVYGLRVSEVRRLTLADLNWQTNLIRIRRTKPNEHVQFYPLSSVVAVALARYLVEVRPRLSRREVFVHLRAPFEPLSNSAIWQLVSHRLLPLEPSLKHHGPHVLRHACATHLLESGMTIKEIGDFLGHKSPASTAVYTAVDLAGLRRVAEFDLTRFL
jgi:integrase/recombinase XerD